jgi:branched-chain amino acid transport system substrate-binding protein
MRRRNWIIVAIAGVLVLGVAIILLVRQLTQPIRIGVVLPITTSLGNEENLFVRYYRDAHPRIGLRPVEYLIENPSPNEVDVKNAYQRLEAQGVSVIIGGVLSQDGAWLADRSAQTGVPTFGITSSSAALSGKKDAFFRLCATNAAQAKAVGQYYQNKGINRLILVTSVENAVYVDPYVKVIGENFAGQIVQMPFVPEAATYDKLFQAAPDAVFTILAAKDVIQVIKAVREKSRTLPIGSSSWGTVEILTLYSGPLLDGVQFFSLSSALVGDAYKAELADFEQKYNMKATNGSQYTVSILHLLYAAISEVGASRPALKAYLETPRTYETIYGPIAVDAYGDATPRRVTILQTVNGAMNTTEEVEVK